VLLDVDGREKELLLEELGPDAFDRARGAAARGARGGKLGRVLVLPGIMGTELDSVDAKGDSDRIWLNYARLIGGRIGDLELAADGSPAVPGLHVRPAGVHRKTYLPMILELDTRWHVRPFPVRTGGRTSTRAPTGLRARFRRSAPVARCISSPIRWAASCRGGSSNATATCGSPWTTPKARGVAGAS
jgi:hypothetical protein